MADWDALVTSQASGVRQQLGATADIVTRPRYREVGDAKERLLWAAGRARR